MLSRRVRSQKGAALSGVQYEGNLFGPQSKWSSLLRRREHLQNEIARGRRHLEHLRKELAECDALVRAWPPALNGSPGKRQASVAVDSMEEYLSGWLVHLEEQLDAVVSEIEAVAQENAVEPIAPEGSMCELLRTAR
ncbi:MAG TPA: hypothetical protein VMU04_08850 [Candidatus Acidoferrum sp.]|nr:hypothetical protein [Candidatus Acidoferrum sp.]